MTKILLVRHGETVWNAEQRVQGWLNSDLSARGEMQARRLADRLARTPVSAVYASDLSRTFETARLLAFPHGLPVLTDPRLRERGYGDWEGLTVADLERQYPDAWHRFHHLRQLDVPVPGGETWADVQARILPALSQILADHTGADETVAIIGHGGSLRALVLDALAAPLETLLRLRLDNASLSRLDYRDRAQGRVVFLNDVSHLEERD